MKRRLLLLLWLVVLSACGERIPGASIDLRVHVAALDQASHDRNGIIVNRGWLTVFSAQIFECPSMARRIANELSPLSSAWAHGTAAPTRIATPHVIDLSTDAQLELGAFLPSPGRWCSVHLTLAPADDDAEGLNATPQMNGRTLVLETSGGTLSSSIDTVGVTLALDPIIEISEAHPHAVIDFALTPRPWLLESAAEEPSLLSTAGALIHP